MNKFYILLFTIVLFSCDGNNNPNNCNFLLNIGVNLSVNLNLPQFSQLQFSGNSMRVEGQGNGGIILARVGSGLRAWDGADPNVPFSNCSILQVDSLFATSTCEESNRYELSSGQMLGDNPLPCTLIAYRVDDLGNNQFLISN